MNLTGWAYGQALWSIDGEIMIGSALSLKPVFTLEGKRVLVVGAGRPADSDLPLANGNATCRAIAQSGGIVACADRDAHAAQRTVDDVLGAGGHAMRLIADVSCTEQIPELFDCAIKVMGGLDGLVMNVGISFRTRLMDLDSRQWDQVMNVNTKAHVFCAKEALSRMTNGGSIVFVSSTASRRPAGRNPAYEASKAALSAVCRSVALEGQPLGIRSNSVVLGLIDTPMGRLASQARPGRVKQPLPFGRQGNALEVAAAICFLLSDQASYINAAELPVDGGRMAGISLQ